MLFITVKGDSNKTFANGVLPLLFSPAPLHSIYPPCAMLITVPIYEQQPVPTAISHVSGLSTSMKQLI